jgi:hypothetical protein
MFFIDPHGGDAGGSKVVFREEFVARGLAHARRKEKLICGGGVKPMPLSRRRGRF